MQQLMTVNRKVTFLIIAIFIVMGCIATRLYQLQVIEMRDLFFHEPEKLSTY